MLALLGGTPRSNLPLEIVRPDFPRLATFAEAFDQALSTGRVTNHGAHVARFESEVSAALGVPTLAFSSGQAALLIMLAAAELGRDEVIVPSYTFAATPHAVRWAGAEPVFAEIDPATMTLDAADVAARITPRTRAILGVCAYGIPCDYAGLQAVADRHRVRLLFDSAPAFGSARDGRLIGGFGDAQVFSFHATKAFSTMEGGALATHDAALLERARALRNFGQSDGADCRAPGLNGKMMEVAAMIGTLQLARLTSVRARRREVAESYRRRLRHVPGLRLAWPRAGDDPIWLYFPLIVDPASFGLDRDQLGAALAAENIRTRKYFEIPCHKMSCYVSDKGPHLPVSDRFAAGALALPVYNDQTEAEVAAVCDAILTIHDNADRVRGHFAAASLARAHAPA